MGSGKWGGLGIGFPGGSERYASDQPRQVSGDKYVASCVSGIRQAEKKISRRCGDGNAVGAVGDTDAATGRPIGRQSEVVVLLQAPASYALPIHHHRAAGLTDVKRRRAGCLRHGNETPEAASEGIIAAAHRTARIRLADGAGDLERRSRARAAAAGDFIPVNRIALRGGGQTSDGRKQTRNAEPANDFDFHVESG